MFQFDVALVQAVPAYSYKHDRALSPGQLVVVPLGRKEVLGVVLGPAQTMLEEAKLKEIVRILDHPALSLQDVQLLQWASYYYLADIGLFARIMLRGLKDHLAARKPRMLRPGPMAGQSRSKARHDALHALSAEQLDAPSLARKSQVSAGLIRNMIKDQELVEEDGDPFAGASDAFGVWVDGPDMLPAQEELVEAIDGGCGFRTELIHGVTGSGKTLIYAHLIARMLAQGRQILFLVPEIALAQTLSDRFGMLLAHDDVESPILMWHGGLAMGRRSHVWRRVQSGAPLLLVGVRSASLLPMPNLGLVVVDEEHDHSFKQDEAPHYHARDIAIKRAQQADVAVVLGSATPSMESLVRSQQQRRHHRLTMRAMGHEPVRPEMIDLRHVPVEPGHCLAPPMVAAVGEHLARGEQALLYLNRRGYAPLMSCQSCGHRPSCPDCGVRLVPHRRQHRLLCHWCGHASPIWDKCPQCHEGLPAFYGIGIERLAEEVAGLFPDMRIEIASSDMLQSPAKAAALWGDMHAGKINILLGTQVAAKGHDIPGLTMVGVVDGDPDHDAIDFRARERLYQALDQVGGRAGRHRAQGRVLVQTSCPEDSLFGFLGEGDFLGFAQDEENRRRRNMLPPFTRMAALVLSSSKPRDAEELGFAMARQARALPVDGASWMGPVPAPMNMLRGQSRWRALLRAENRKSLENALASWVLPVKPPAGARVDVDVDPQSFY